MSELKNIQEAAQQYRELISDNKIKLQQNKAQQSLLERTFDKEARGLNLEDLNEAKTKFNQKKETLDIKINEQLEEQKNIRDNFDKKWNVFLPKLDPTKAIAELSDNYPLLLFPLRLEIRFKIIDQQHQLWLRVYPDDCNVQHKEYILSESELNNAKQFWINYWKAGGIEKDERGAWAGLVNSHGSGRSTYIINEFKPSKPSPIKANEKQQFLIITSTLALTATEKGAADAYWIAFWLANKDAVKLQQALNDLTTAVGSAKASEIILNYIPDNIADAVPSGTSNADVFIWNLKLPAYASKSSSWTQEPAVEALPDKFVVVLKKGITERTELFEYGVTENLAVGIDPSLSPDKQIQKDANGNLILNDEVQWMVDFDKAIQVGMAIKINLTAAEYTNGFDSLKVIGIRLSSNEQQGKKELEDLLSHHFYSKNGFGLLKQGTPTNNTEDNPSGYSWLDNPDESYGRIFKNREHFEEVAELDKKSDGEKLADALGIDTDLLKLVPNANGKDQLEANAMNKALFPATMGYFMEEMMHPLFDDKEISETKSFFSNYVSGRGPIPAIHIGKQPYGILPVSVYSKMNFKRNVDGNFASEIKSNNFYANLHALLMQMDEEWKTMANSVPHVGQATDDPHQILLDVLGLHANSVEFHQRYAQTLKQLYNQIALKAAPLFGGLIAAAIAKRGKTILDKLGLDSEMKLPILEKFFFGNPNLLKGDLIDDVPDSEENPIRKYSADNKNYIEWLATSDANTIRIENFGGNEGPTALLYILLRHALMQAQADATTRTLITAKLIKDKTVYYDPDFISIKDNETGKSKFEHMYSKFPAITGNPDTLLSEHIYLPAVLNLRKETIRLNETLEALNILKNVPTARLERLLVEHIDCCNYRLDAWFTALVQAKLKEQRIIQKTNNQKGKGIFLGAYGWLLDIKPENKVLQPVQLSNELSNIFKTDDNKPLMSDNTNLGFIHAPSINQAATAAILRNAFESNKDAGTGNQFAINLSSDRVRIADSFLEGVRNGQSLSALLGYQFERGLHDKHSLGKGEVDKFIYPLRMAFPLQSNQLEDTKTDDAESIESIEARNVIDGLKLIQHVQNSSSKVYPFNLPASLKLPAANPKEFDAINFEVQVISDIHDAVGDLILSEQVYQTVLGNFNRASGNADAFSKGNYPPEVQVMDTPRTGITLTHRMGIHLNAMSTAAPTAHVRTLAEPSLQEWLFTLLPTADKVLCKVTYQAPSIVATTITVSQQELNLEALDLLYILKLDSEQAMTEIDDRISNFIRYNIAPHPDVQIVIDYTSQIDLDDRSKISFFELSSLMNPLRRIVKGDRYLQPYHLALSQAGETVTAEMNDVLLKQRITDVKNKLELKLSEVSPLLSGIVSISSLSYQLRLQLEANTVDKALISSVLLQFEIDCKNYLKDSSAAYKTIFSDGFETAISLIGNSAVIATLKTLYANLLDAYVADLSNIDNQIHNTCNLYEELSLYEHSQAGTGFMHQAIRNLYQQVFDKSNTLIKRWEEKKVQFTTIMTGYNSAGLQDEQFVLLQSAEQLISTQITTPLPTDFNIYKSVIIDVKKDAFDAFLAVINTHAANNKTTVTAFMQDVETSLKSLNEFDAINFDTGLSRNDLAAERLLLAQLKEDMVASIKAVNNYFTKAIDDCTVALADADKLTVNIDKINALLLASKKILGDEALFIPQFRLDTSTANEFEKAYHAGITENILQFSKTSDNRILPIEDWLTGVARVKEKVHDWEHIGILSTAFNSDVNTELVPIQLPFLANDRWLALKFKDEKDPSDNFIVNEDKLIYTSHFAAEFNKANPLCGIILDDWTEVIPNETQTTGVAFHYDQPNSEPPQAMLLVVPPQIKGNWDWKDVVNALDETLEMAKKRAVEPAKIEGSNYGQFIPSTMMAVSKNWITVAANLSMNNNIYKMIKTN